MMNQLYPNNKEAEQTVLGAMMIDKECVIMANEILTPDDFYYEEHKEIFKATQELDTAKKPVEMISVNEQLKTKGLSVKVGGIEYLNELTDVVLTTSSTRYYCKLIKEKATYRKILEISQNVSDKASEGTEELNTILHELTKQIQSIQTNTVENEDNKLVSESLYDVVEEIAESNKKGCMVGLSTGFKQLDYLTGGWQSGRYYILGARPKMGKTSLFCQIADTASRHIPVVIFSLEMTKKEILKLLIYQNAKVDSMKEQAGKLSDTDLNQMIQGCDSLYKGKLFIDDKSRNIPQIIASINKAQRLFTSRNMGNIGLIVVDYVQLIRGDKKMQRNYQLEEISRSLKEISKDFNCCVLTLSQLNREVENRKDYKPLPSDIKDSGSFEQDCDGLMLMYRDAYYNGQTRENTRRYKYRENDLIADVVDINFFLNRHGPADKFQIDFITPHRRFQDEGGVRIE